MNLGSRQESLSETRLPPRLASKRGADRNILVEPMDKQRGEFGPSVGDRALCSEQGSPSLGALAPPVLLILQEVATVQAEAWLLSGLKLLLALPYD